MATKKRKMPVFEEESIPTIRMDQLSLNQLVVIKDMALTGVGYSTVASMHNVTVDLIKKCVC
jgi:hypothetical protein